MKKLSLILAILVLAPSVAHAYYRAYGWCERGGQVVVTPGAANSTTKVQRSYPACTITVFNMGTAVLSTVYSDSAGTPKANPFTAQSDGYWFFYAANARYDVVLSGAGITVPFTYSDILLFDPAAAPPGVTSFNGRTAAVVPALNDYNFNLLAGTLATAQVGAPQGAGAKVQLAGVNSGVSGAILCDDAGGSTTTVGCSVTTTQLASKQGAGANVQTAGVNSGVLGASLCNDAGGATTTSGCVPPLPASTLWRQFLRIKPDVANVTTPEFVAEPVLYAEQYAFTPQAPASNLVAAVDATITLTTCPTGLNWNNTNHRLRITDAVSGNETVLIKAAGPGTCTSGLITGGAITLTGITLNHTSGNWTLGPAWAGAQEAIYSSANPGTVQLPAAAALNVYGTLYIDRPVWLRGNNIDATRVLINDTTSDVIQVHDDFVKITDLKIDKAGGVGARTADGIEIDAGYVYTTLQDVNIQHQAIGVNNHGATFANRVYVGTSGTGFYTDFNEVYLSACQFLGNTTYGIHVAGGTGVTISGGTTAGQSGVSNLFVSGTVADLFVDDSIAAITTNGPNIDLSTAVIVRNFAVNNSLIELNGGVHPAIRVGDVVAVAITGGIVNTPAGNKVIEIVSPTFATYVTVTGVQMGTTGIGIDASGGTAVGPLILTGNTFAGPMTNVLKVGGSLPTNQLVFTGNFVSSIGDPISGSLDVTNRTLAISGNTWPGATLNSYPSAASITLKSQDQFVVITGAVSIQTILDRWMGRSVTLYFTDPAPGGVTTGGDITVPVAVAQYGTITLDCVGATWLPRGPYRFANPGVGAVLAVAANAITLTHPLHHVGAGLIKTINLATGLLNGCVELVPDAAFTYDATGNIVVPAGGGLAVVNKLMRVCYDGVKFTPSY